MKVSEIGLGVMTFAGRSNEAKSYRTRDDATDRGVAFIDTADADPISPDPETAIRTEKAIGRWLEKEGGRDRFVIATRCRSKVGHGPNDRGLSRRHILAAREASPRRLKVDSIDLDHSHSHRPDPETSIDETLRAFDDLVRTGKVRPAGCSNYATWPLAPALSSRGTGREQRGDSLSSPPGPAVQPYQIKPGRYLRSVPCVGGFSSERSISSGEVARSSVRMPSRWSISCWRTRA